MRHIDNSQLRGRIPPKWHDRAQKAKDKVSKASSQLERGEFIDARASIWADIKQYLEDLSDRRCWYCESSEIRSDLPVDHFRPKKSVVEDPSHPGYWWLAFEILNFRLSCTFCNSWRIDERRGTKGGKHDHFPLLEGSPRARNATDDLSAERPVLLDPCDHRDPPLLTFRQDGMPIPKASDVKAVEYIRADRSIHWYHLDHHLIVSQRKDVWKQVDDLVNRGIRCLSAGCSLDDVKEDLYKIARCSRVAHTALRGRRDVPWVETWLDEIGATLP